MFQPPIFMNGDGTLLDDTEERIAGRHLNHFNIYFGTRAAAAGRVAQPPAGDRRGRRGSGSPSRSRPTRATRFSDNPRRGLASDRLLAVARADRLRGDRATRTRCASSATSRARSTAPSASASRCTRWPTSRPSRAGRAGRARSARTPSSSRQHRRRLHPRLPGRRRSARDTVACMTKHFPGGGPQLDGEDPHFPYGKEQVYPGGHFELPPAARSRPPSRPGPRRSCPTTACPVGTELEEVGFGFNRDVITGPAARALRLRRRRLHRLGARHRRAMLDGSVVRREVLGRRASRRAQERVVQSRSRPACDQFGGEALPEVLVELVEPGASPRRGSTNRPPPAARQVPARPLRRSVRRPRGGRARRRQRRVPCRRRARRSAARSCCSNRTTACCRSRGEPRVYVEGLDPSRGAVRRGRRTPPRPTSRSCACTRPSSRATAFLETLLPRGRPRLQPPERSRSCSSSRAACRRSSTSTSTAPAVLPELAAACAGARRRASARPTSALLDVLFGRARARGPAAVRAAVVDGGREAAAPRRAARLARPAVSLRARAAVRDVDRVRLVAALGLILVAVSVPEPRSRDAARAA